MNDSIPSVAVLSKPAQSDAVCESTQSLNRPNSSCDSDSTQ